MPKWEIFCRLNRFSYLWWEFHLFKRSICEKLSNKSSTTNTLLIVGAAAAAWWFFTRANALNSLVFVPKGIGIQGGGLNLLLGVQNPTGAAIQLNSLAGSVNVNGSPIGNVSSFQPITIAPNAETVVPLYLAASPFGIVAQTVNLLDGNEGAGNFSASLSGTANINNIPVPINLSFTS